MKLSEDKLSSAIRAGRFERVYFIYGKEPFLIQMYVDRIIKKTVGEDALDFNLQRLDGCPEPDLLSDYVDTLPVFAEVKVITVKDFDPEKLVAATEKKYHEIVSNVPDSAILVLYCINTEIDEKKSKTKKLVEVIDKAGAVCCIEQMQAPKIAELCVKKAAKEGVVISQADALFLTERVGSRMNVASDETAKLISYVGTGGTITREQIDMLVPKQLEAQVFDLANAINAGQRADSYRIIDELFRKQINAVTIMGALSSTYLDMYCA
ncbi:MAG: DNA polymerase III subunit delta, partial [Ruminiclostridium sp.]|nr:DNA polymerase III subunit delta [Ruminiclostridium sp.]